MRITQCFSKYKWFESTLVGLLIILLFDSLAWSAEATRTSPDNAQLFLSLLHDTPDREALHNIRKNWQPGFVPMVLEVIRFNRNFPVNYSLIVLLEEKTGKRFGFDINAWYQWIWNKEPEMIEDYAEFKSQLYAKIDPVFRGYFNNQRTAKIRLDEVRWGGVLQDGIPPLRAPDMISVKEAAYLEDNHIVFGVELNGDVRAYPKRIMAWHEMFVDQVGGINVAGVYCTLCGSMILYKTDLDGEHHEVGTSGFLYRSNKLMYDKKTQSLWNTLWGQPVIGPLADKDITLERLYIVTTTWGEWKRRHPDTLVLSLNTGYQRDYGEGVAYRQYFATDELMFSVPKLDLRLRNKADVLGLLFSSQPDEPLAISSAYLKQNPLYHDKIGNIDFVVLTDPSGASRVYETKGHIFKKWDQDRTAIDTQGASWTMMEEKLTSVDGKVLYRLPAHRAFWFGWYSAYAHTRLVM